MKFTRHNGNLFKTNFIVETFFILKDWSKTFRLCFKCKVETFKLLWCKSGEMLSLFRVILCNHIFQHLYNIISALFLGK